MAASHLVSMFPLKTCLVTGASGFLGRQLCHQLQAKGVRVRALLRQNQQGPWDETVICDLKNFASHQQELFRNIDTVFHLASIAHNKAPKQEYEDINVRLCLLFAQAAIDQGVKRFIYVSSTKAIAEPCNQVADEQFLEWPRDVYGMSKRRAEEALLKLSAFEHLCILRPCLIYGAGAQGNLYAMMKWINKGLFPSLPDSGAKRSMISVRDVSSALIAAACDPRANRKVYLLSDGQSYSIKQIENDMRLALHKKIPCWSIPLWSMRALAVVGDAIKKKIKKFPLGSEMVHKLIGPALYSSQKIQSELDWRPEDNFSLVLPEMTAHFLDVERTRS